MTGSRVNPPRTSRRPDRQTLTYRCVTGGWTNSDENAYYMGFQLGEPAQPTAITLPVVWGSDLPPGIALTLWNSSGGAPGTLLLFATGAGLVIQRVRHRRRG